MCIKTLKLSIKNEADSMFFYKVANAAYCLPERKNFVFNFYFYFILLYNTVLVLPYIDMN